MNAPAGKRNWKQRLEKALLIGFVVGVLCLGVVIWRTFVLVSDEIPTAYAGWAAWELIQTHLITHSNQWPRGIYDLEVAVTNTDRGGAHYHVNELTNRIAINWNVDVESLRASARTNASHPLLVTRRDGKPIYPVWRVEREPNHKLEEILGLPTGFLRATN